MTGSSAKTTWNQRCAPGDDRPQQGADGLLGHLALGVHVDGDLHRDAVHVPAVVREAERSERVGYDERRWRRATVLDLRCGGGPGRRDGPIRPRRVPGSRPSSSSISETASSEAGFSGSRCPERQ